MKNIVNFKIFVIFSAFLFLLVFFPLKTNAQIPFGGKIISVIPCTCNMMVGNMAVLINQLPAAGPPQLIFQLGLSRLYAYYQLVPGAWILGKTLGASTCWIGVIPFCVPAAPVAPLINFVGTSAGPVGFDNSMFPNWPNNGNSNGNQFPPNNTQQPPQNYVNPCLNSDQRPIAYTAANEGCRNERYIDSEGYATIGCGHRITGNENFNTNYISDEQMSQLYQQDYAQAQIDARGAASQWGVDFDSLSPSRQAVLTDMAFNMGEGSRSAGSGLAGFKNMWGAIRQENWQTAGNEVVSSTYSGQTGQRAQTNAEIMRTNNADLMNYRISGDSDAQNICNNQGGLVEA